MSSVINSSGGPLGTRIQTLDSVPGQWASLDLILGLQRLPTESIGSFTLTLTNIVVGSAIQISTLSGTAIENRTATHTTEVFTVPAYGSGNSANSLDIKVRKGTASPFYQPYETQATASVGSQSIFVSQTPDE